eukprot:353863_1
MSDEGLSSEFSSPNTSRSDELETSQSPGWTCKACTFKNEEAKKYCDVCQKKRAVSESWPGWCCEACTFKNEESKDHCDVCHMVRQVSRPESALSSESSSVKLAVPTRPGHPAEYSSRSKFKPLDVEIVDVDILTGSMPRSSSDEFLHAPSKNQDTETETRRDHSRKLSRLSISRSSVRSTSFEDKKSKYFASKTYSRSARMSRMIQERLSIFNFERSDSVGFGIDQEKQSNDFEEMDAGHIPVRRASRLSKTITPTPAAIKKEKSGGVQRVSKVDDIVDESVGLTYQNKMTFDKLHESRMLDFKNYLSRGGVTQALAKTVEKIRSKETWPESPLPVFRKFMGVIEQSTYDALLQRAEELKAQIE